MSERVLILGGTGEARALAAALVDRDVPVISSLAGRVRNPRLPVGQVRIGGFGGVEGLASWLDDEQISAVVDATHPFAARITAHAVAAARRAGVPLLRLARPAWEPGRDDRWTRVPDVAAAARTVAERGGRVFLTTGRQDVDAFADVADAWFLIRVVDPPVGPLPPRHRILSSRGPYDLAGERKILAENEISLLVTKNSGGELTRAKLVAAAEAGIEVVMVDRPAEPEGSARVDSVDGALAWLQARAGAA
ncbi:MAG: cobalt-precorrin-6A reductase [Gordonia sp. (in: high G+C Gram-positive bacteria)]|uniref:cobalt-precorrin-6A reductase n=1 Tax=Gordonia sp. (in: high G+C Gram-positive bacteria) TaxID=84139 RepID=UPI0039E279A4